MIWCLGLRKDRQSCIGNNVPKSIYEIDKNKQHLQAMGKLIREHCKKEDIILKYGGCSMHHGLSYLYCGFWDTIPFLGDICLWVYPNANITCEFGSVDPDRCGAEFTGNLASPDCLANLVSWIKSYGQ